MPRFIAGDLVWTPGGAATVRYFREPEIEVPDDGKEHGIYGVQLDNAPQSTISDLYPAREVSSLNGRMRAYTDLVDLICKEAVINNKSAYLPAELIERANKLLLEDTSR